MVMGGEGRGAGTLVLGGGKEGSWWMGRAEVDTSAPFESVKEAVDRFGGSGRWRPQYKSQRSCGSENSLDEINIITSVEDETAQLQKDLMVKERETLEILKELETTKKFMDGLKQKLHKEEMSAPIAQSTRSPDRTTKVHPMTDMEECQPSKPDIASSMKGTKPLPPLSPSQILMQLKQAKLNLSRSTSDIVCIRSSIETVTRGLEEEKISLEKARNRLASNSSSISNLEKELSQTRLMLQLIKDSGTLTSGNVPDISRKLHELRSETEQFKRIAEAGKAEVSKLSGDIEQSRAGAKTAEIRLLAARKMEAAARATESSTKAEIKALTSSENSAAGSQNSIGVTLSIDEYNMLVQKAQEAEGLSRKRIEDATAQVDEAMKHKMELLKKVEEVKAEVRTGKRVLSEALFRVDVANKGKLAVEEALRKWRSENGHRRRSVYNSPRFKNSFPGHHRRDSKTRDLNAVSTTVSAVESAKATLTPSLSIGQILSRKLVGPEDYETFSRASMSTKPKISLDQMLNNRRMGASSSETSGEGVDPQWQFRPKKKRFGLMRLALILAKHRKIEKSKTKKKTHGARCNLKF